MLYLSVEGKKKLFSQHGVGKSKTDTGSPESQIALFTYRINHLTQHLANQKKDLSAHRGLIQLVGKRKKMLNYLRNTNVNRYRAILTDLNLRK